jgi:SAM-dependent methyltransferase
MLAKLIRSLLIIILPRKLRKYLRENRFYWKYKDIINPFYKKNFDHHLSSNWDIERRIDYSNYINQNNLKMIFEFGCAPSLTLLNILRNCPQSQVFGYDINTSHMSYAIDAAPESFTSRSKFYVELNKEDMLNDLRLENQSSFDLVIFDRVLMYLSDEQIEEHLHTYAGIYQQVLIDDFFGNQQGNYRHRDFSNIMELHGYREDIVENSKYSTIGMAGNNSKKAIYTRLTKEL